MSGTGAIELRVSERDEDAAGIDRLTRQLRRQLEELDVESVEQVTEDTPPEGAKAVEALVIGKLLVRYGPGALQTILGTVQRWVARDEAREVTFEYGDLKLHLKGATAANQQLAMDEFIRAVEAKRRV